MQSFFHKNPIADFTKAIAPISCLVSLFFGLAMAVSAQTATELSLGSAADSAAGSAARVIFQPPTDEKADDSRGGASRPSAIKCRGDRASDVALTALIPHSNQGLTVASHPTFFVYVPPTSAPQIYFSLKDENNLGIYQTMLPISGQEGVISISLPTDQPALEIGQTYSWSVGLVCQPTQTDMPWVKGTVQRVETEASIAASQPGANPTIYRAVLYARSGIWYDTLTTLFQLRQPDNLTSDLTDNLTSNSNGDRAIDRGLLHQNWVNLLNSVGLEAIADRPLLDQP